MDKITEILEHINTSSNEVESVIDNEYELVNSISGVFSSIVKETHDFSDITMKNSGRVVGIKTAITEQNNAIHELKDKMEDVRVLSERLV